MILPSSLATSQSLRAKPRAAVATNVISLRSQGSSSLIFRHTTRTSKGSKWFRRSKRLTIASFALPTSFAWPRRTANKNKSRRMTSHLSLKVFSRKRKAQCKQSSANCRTRGSDCRRQPTETTWNLKKRLICRSLPKKPNRQSQTKEIHFTFSHREWPNLCSPTNLRRC